MRRNEFRGLVAVLQKAVGDIEDHDPDDTRTQEISTMTTLFRLRLAALLGAALLLLFPSFAVPSPSGPELASVSPFADYQTVPAVWTVCHEPGMPPIDCGWMMAPDSGAAGLEEPPADGLEEPLEGEYWAPQSPDATELFDDLTYPVADEQVVPSEQIDSQC